MPLLSCLKKYSIPHFILAGLFFFYLFPIQCFSQNNAMIRIGDTNHYSLLDIPTTLLLKDGSILLSGIHDSANSGVFFGSAYMGAVIKMNANGNVKWAKSLLGPGQPYFFGLYQ